MKRFIVLAILAGWLMASGADAQGLLPVQVSVEKKEDNSRVVKKRGTSTPVQGGRLYTPEIAERTQKITMVLKLLSMAQTPLSDVAVKYSFIARGRTVSDLRIASEGEKRLDLLPMRPTSIALEPVSFLMEETTYQSGSLNSKNSRDGEQYYGIHVLVQQDNRKIEFADPKDLTVAIKRLKPSNSDGPVSVASAAPATPQVRNAYFDEKPFDKLSDKQITDWGQTALACNTAKWKHGETEHFVIRFFSSGDMIARRCEKFYGEIREFFGNRKDLMEGHKSHVFAFYDPADWKRFKKQVELSDNTAGVARKHEFFYMPLNMDKQFDQFGQTQAHEMTHLVFNRIFVGRLPLWLNEGVAEYFGRKKTTDVNTFRRSVGAAEPFGLDELFKAAKYPKDEKAVHSFYAEAAIVVDFLTQTADRRALLPKFIDQMIAHKDVDAALKLYGYKSRDDFQKAYDRHRSLFPKR